MARYDFITTALAGTDNRGWVTPLSLTLATIARISSSSRTPNGWFLKACKSDNLRYTICSGLSERGASFGWGVGEACFSSGRLPGFDVSFFAPTRSLVHRTDPGEWNDLFRWLIGFLGFLRLWLIRSGLLGRAAFGLIRSFWLSLSGRRFLFLFVLFGLCRCFSLTACKLVDFIRRNNHLASRWSFRGRVAWAPGVSWFRLFRNRLFFYLVRLFGVSFAIRLYLLFYFGA